MTAPAPKLMPPEEAAAVLEKALEPKGRFTVADAAEKSGLALRDTESGLRALAAKYRGHFSATEDGQLLYSFPTGFSRPWIVRSAIDRAFSAVGRSMLGVARFIVRAWIAIVLVGYTAIFVALLIALTFSGSSRSDSRGRGGIRGAEIVFRVLFEAFYWWWHPFSPFRIGYAGGGFAGMGRRTAMDVPEGPKEPFYQKVDRFFFGPTEPPVDPLETERRLVQEIRVQKGRIGIGDVMRVTGLPRDQADGLVSKLLLDYDGDVDVSEDGGIIYRFKALRPTVRIKEASSFGPAAEKHGPGPAKPKVLAPLTGNPGGTNALIIGLNAFNLIMSLYSLANDLTIHRLTLILQKVPLNRIPYEGTAIALGVVPLLFSIALFALPLIRAALRPIKAARVARDNGRLAVMHEVVEGAKTGGVTDVAVKEAWRRATGTDASDREITREVVKLGGDVEVGKQGEVRYRFADLEAEAKALEADREAAAEEEAQVGKVVFTSEN